MAISPRLPELASLELLVSVARSGSIGAAAREQGLSQQAVSVRLRQMESQVGVALLTRDRRGSKLTADGVLVVEWAAGLLQTAAQLDQALATLVADRNAHLVVAASMTVAEHLLPAWLVQLRARQQRSGSPVTTVQLLAANSDSVIEQVGLGKADLGFIEGPGSSQPLRSRVVATDELVVVVSPNHRWARRRRPLEPAELAAEPLVMREPGSGTRSALELALSQALVDFSPVVVALELSTNAAIRSAVLAGAGPAVLSNLTVHDDLVSGRLIRVPTSGLALHRRLRAVWRGSAIPPSGTVRELIALASNSRTEAPPL